jgi:hypothetical protein
MSGTPGISVRAATTRRELTEAFRLVYNAYRLEGLVAAHPLKLRFTAFHLLPTTSVFSAKEADTICGTISLVLEGAYGLPLEREFPEIVADFRRRRTRVAEAIAFAVRRTKPSTDSAVVCRLYGALIQQAAQAGAEHLVATVHPRHLPFYCRRLGFEQVGPLRPCPEVCGNPGIPVAVDIHRALGRVPHAYHKLFGMEFSPEQVRRRPIQIDAANYFHGLLGEAECFPPATQPAIRLTA